MNVGRRQRQNGIIESAKADDAIHEQTFYQTSVILDGKADQLPGIGRDIIVVFFYHPVGAQHSMLLAAGIQTDAATDRPKTAHIIVQRAWHW